MEVTKTLNILIVENNDSIGELEVMIKNLGYKLVKSLNNSEAALKYLSTRPAVDLILMSISIKGLLNGIELAEEIAPLKIPIVFTSVHHDEQVYHRAKQPLPHGFLIKPFKRLTLKSMIESTLARNSAVTAIDKLWYTWQEDNILQQSIFVKSNDKLIKITLNEIVAVEAEGNYCTIYAMNRRFVAKISLKKLKMKLPPRLFYQIHRKYIVHLTNIEAVDLTNDAVNVNGHSWPIGEKFKQGFIKTLNRYRV